MKVPAEKEKIYRVRCPLGVLGDGVVYGGEGAVRASLDGDSHGAAGVYGVTGSVKVNVQVLLSRPE